MLRIQEWVFSGCTVWPYSKETELGRSDLEASPSAGKDWDSLSAMLRMEVCPYSYFRWCRYFRGPSQSVTCYDRCVLSEGYKNYFKDQGLMNPQPNFLFFSYS